MHFNLKGGKKSIVEGGKESIVEGGKESIVEGGKESIVEGGKESIVEGGKGGKGGKPKRNLHFNYCQKQIYAMQIANKGGIK